jgi:hypothetical protein
MTRTISENSARRIARCVGDYEARQLGSAELPPLPPLPVLGPRLLIRNDSGVDLPQGAVVGLGAPVVAPADEATEEQFLEAVHLHGVLPSATDHAEKFAILLEPISAGEDGRAEMDIAQCKVLVEEGGEQLDRAGVDNLESGHLKLSKDGPCKVLWKAPGTGEVWAIVVFSGDGDTIRPCELKGDLAAFGSAEAVDLKWDSGSWTRDEAVNTVHDISGHESLGFDNMPNGQNGAHGWYVLNKESGRREIMWVQPKARRIIGTATVDWSKDATTITIDHVAVTDGGILSIASETQTFTVDNLPKKAGKAGFKILAERYGSGSWRAYEIEELDDTATREAYIVMGTLAAELSGSSSSATIGSLQGIGGQPPTGSITASNPMHKSGAAGATVVAKRLWDSTGPTNNWIITSAPGIAKEVVVDVRLNDMALEIKQQSQYLNSAGAEGEWEMIVDGDDQCPETP